MKRSRGRQAAEAMAFTALGTIASDEAVLSRFLALTGLDSGSVRDQVQNPAFLRALMEFVMEDDALVLAVARDAGERPEEVVAAAHALGAVPWERDHA